MLSQCGCFRVGFTSAGGSSLTEEALGDWGWGGQPTQLEFKCGVLKLQFYRLPNSSSRLTGVLVMSPLAMLLQQVHSFTAKGCPLLG